MHRLYTLQPPHDTFLYDVLDVKPNATVAQITKSYRKLSRKYHPDKQRHRKRPDTTTTTTTTRQPNDNNDEDCEEKLEQVREAYEVLKDDATRLPYHKYGLSETSTAAFLLTGGKHGVTTKEQRQLLWWMGYGPAYRPKTRHKQRVYFLAANIVERIRPLVEGTLSESVLAESIAREIDTLKRLPLGAQILRCVGRAYRHSGQRVLRQHEHLQKQQQKQRGHRFVTTTAATTTSFMDARTRTTTPIPPLLLLGQMKKLELTENVRHTIRDARQLFEAAAVSGKLVWKEQALKKKQKQLELRKEKERKMASTPSIDYHDNFGGDMDLDLIRDDTEFDELSDYVQTNEEIKETEQLKAQNALLETLQVEALWKISKIDLDKTIQEACNLILTGQYFFFPSHRSSTRRDYRRGGDGWVSASGEMIDAHVGRIRAARAMVLMGDVMVRCTKEGTSWVE